MKDLLSDELLDSIDGAIAKSMSARTFSVGELIGQRFQVERAVGRGNFGFVYRVKDTASGKTRAVKTFYEKYTSRPGAADRLRELGARLSHLTHPNLVRVFEVGAEGELLYFIEEFVSALTLDKLVAAVRKHAADQGFPPDQLAELIHQVCSLLQQHQDLPHFALHPANIFMSKQGVKVADLGVAGAFRQFLIDKDFAAMSGQAFLAPEFQTRGTLSPNADIFALGRLLEYVLTLGDFGQLGAVTEIKGPHPRRLLDLARSAADPDPDLRLPTPDAFLGAFELARQAGAPPEAAAPVVEAVPLAEARLEAAVETAFDALHERVAHEAAVDRPIPHEEPGELPAPDEVSAALADVEKEFFREGGAVAAAPAPASAVAAPRAAAVKPPAAPQAKPAWGRWLAAAAVFAALVGAVYLGLQIKPPAKPLPPPPKPIGDANIFNLEGVTITPEPGGPSFADMVAALAAQADEYFKTNRITDPPDDSAFGIYSFILDIDPKNQAALEGIKRIENHYLTLGRGLLKTKKYDKAEWSFKKVLSVNGNNEDAKRGLADAEKALKKEGRPPEPGGPGEKPEPPTPPEKGQPIAPTGPGETGEPLKKVTANDIQATISKYMGRVKFCFAKNPEAKGVAKVRFVVNPDGSVSDVSMAESTIGNADIEQCLVRRVAVMRFPAFEGAAKTVTFPFRFNE